MLFNGFRIGSELDDLFIGESLRLGKVFRYFSFFYIAARFTIEFDGFFIDMAGSNGEVFLVDDEVILNSELDAYTMLRLGSLGLKSDSVDLQKYRITFLNELIDENNIHTFG